MRFLEFTARRIARRGILAAIELRMLCVYEGRERRDWLDLEAAHYTLDAMHYSEPVYSFGERLKVIFVGPFILLIFKILIRIYRRFIRCKAEEA